jgi:hypothetical protein
VPRSTGTSQSQLPRWARTRPQRLEGARVAAGTPWRFQRAIDRIEPAITEVLAEHATEYWRRGFVRREVPRRPGGGGPDVIWVIDGEVVLEFRFEERGPSELVVHDFSLFEPLRKAVRTGHVTIRFARVRELESAPSLLRATLRLA